MERETKEVFSNAMLTQRELIENWIRTSIDERKLAIDGASFWIAAAVAAAAAFTASTANCYNSYSSIQSSIEQTVFYHSEMKNAIFSINFKCQTNMKKISKIFTLKSWKISTNLVAISIKSEYQKRVSWVYLAVVCVGFVSSFELLYIGKMCRDAYVLAYTGERLVVCVHEYMLCSSLIACVCACMHVCMDYKVKPSGFSSFLHTNTRSHKHTLGRKFCSDFIDCSTHKWPFLLVRTWSMFKCVVVFREKRMLSHREWTEKRTEREREKCVFCWFA